MDCHSDAHRPRPGRRRPPMVAHAKPTLAAFSSVPTSSQGNTIASVRKAIGAGKRAMTSSRWNVS
jgi:hypothetical protein